MFLQSSRGYSPRKINLEAQHVERVPISIQYKPYMYVVPFLNKYLCRVVYGKPDNSSR